jgi:hypothetical protein
MILECLTGGVWDVGHFNVQVVSFHTANNSGFYEDGGLVGDGGLLQRSLTGGDIAGVVLQAVDTAFRNVTIVTKVTDVISETGKYNSLVDGANI